MPSSVSPSWNAWAATTTGVAITEHDESDGRSRVHPAHRDVRKADIETRVRCRSDACGRHRIGCGQARVRKIQPVPERVLLIEDDERLSAMLSEYLATMGFEARAAPDAASGLDALAGDPFDALVLDIMLPDRDGFDVCREVRARSDIPILMLTARGDETDRIVGSKSAPTTTCRSPSTRASWSHACAQFCAAVARPTLRQPACASATS